MPKHHTTDEALHAWQVRIERHVAKTGPGIARGGRAARPVAADAWHCEGAWQPAEQMDIWQCCDEVALDQQDDETDEDIPSDTDEPEQV